MNKNYPKENQPSCSSSLGEVEVRVGSKNEPGYGGKIGKELLSQSVGEANEWYIWPKEKLTVA